MAGSKDKQAEPTKRPRLAQTDQAMASASAPRPRRAIQPLTMTELTRCFLAIGSRARGGSPGVAPSPPPRKGSPLWLHFFGCGGHSLPLSLELKAPGGDHGSPMGRLHLRRSRAHFQRRPTRSLYSREIALCSARTTAKKDAVLLELRLKRHMLTYARLIEDYEGELLGKRPQGSLARKARGAPPNTD